jgi:hypothetical protein
METIMKRVFAVAVGAVIGVLLAGAVSPMLMMAAPPQLRGPVLLWGTALVVVPATIWASWRLSRSRDA